MKLDHCIWSCSGICCVSSRNRIGVTNYSIHI